MYLLYFHFLPCEHDWFSLCINHGVLRITARTSDKVVLKLEGRLVGPWVDELRTLVWKTNACRMPLEIDVSDLTFADDDGEQVLLWLQKTGARFCATGPFSDYLLKRLGIPFQNTPAHGSELSSFGMPHFESGTEPHSTTGDGQTPEMPERGVRSPNHTPVPCKSKKSQKGIKRRGIEPMVTAPKFRIDAAMNDLLMNSNSQPAPPKENGEKFPDAIFPQYPSRFNDPGPETPPEKRKWTATQLLRTTRGWLGPYLRSRLLPGDFHPITAYLFVEYKCNLDCWYCPSYDNKVKGMSEDIARRSIDWLHDHGGRVLALMGGEPLLRPKFIHKLVYYAAKKGMWVYVATNARLLKPDVADRLGDAGVAVFNIAVDSWKERESLPKAFVPIEKNLEHTLRKQYVYGYLTFFNINICRNNHEDVKRLTEWAREHRIATDYHINESPMLDQSDHFKHIENNPTYLGPEDWRSVDELVDWIVEKNKAGYQMVNSVPRLLEMKTFMRMSSGLDLRKVGWNGDGTGEDSELAKMLVASPGIVQESSGDIHFADWNCRAGQNNVVIRTDGTLAPCFPLYPATFDWGNIEHFRLNYVQLNSMKNTCQRHCFSTLNHNLAYCYNDARVIKWIWQQAKNGFKGGARSFE